MYSASEALSGLGVRPGPIAAHRLSAKLSSLAWSPALAGVVTVGDYDGSVVQACINHSHRMHRVSVVVCSGFTLLVVRVLMCLQPSVSGPEAHCNIAQL